MGLLAESRTFAGTRIIATLGLRHEPRLVEPMDIIVAIEATSRPDMRHFLDIALKSIVMTEAVSRISIYLTI